MNIFDLDPRLQEYISKKRFYKDNNINTFITLEQEYHITPGDMEKIRTYRKKQKQQEKVNSWQNMIQEPKHDIYANNQAPMPDLDAQFGKLDVQKNDPRFDKLKEKQRRDREAANNKNLSYMFDKNNQNYQDDFFKDADFDKYEKNYKSKYNINQQQDYVKPPKILYNVRQYNSNKKDQVNNIIGDEQTYVQSNSFHELDNDMMLDDLTKSSVPNVRSSKRSLNSTYKSVPYMPGETNYCTYMNDPRPTRGRREYGTPNPVEHYFTYINDDMQKPDHVVLPFPRGGEASRDTKKTTAKPYTREVY